MLRGTLYRNEAGRAGLAGSVASAFLAGCGRSVLNDFDPRRAATANGQAQAPKSAGLQSTKNRQPRRGLQTSETATWLWVACSAWLAGRPTGRDATGLRTTPSAPSLRGGLYRTEAGRSGLAQLVEDPFLAGCGRGLFDDFDSRRAATDNGQAQAPKSAGAKLTKNRQPRRGLHTPEKTGRLWVACSAWLAGRPTRRDAKPWSPSASEPRPRGTLYRNEVEQAGLALSVASAFLRGFGRGVRAHFDSRYAATANGQAQAPKGA